MRKREENYFVKRYTEPLTIGVKIRYRPAQELVLPGADTQSAVKSLCVAAEPCVSLVMLVSEKSGEESFERYYIYDTKETSYRMLSFLPSPGGKEPLQIAYRKEKLILRFDNRIDIICLRKGVVETISKGSLWMAAADRLYLLSEDRKRIFVYGYDRTYLEEIEAPDASQIVAIDYGSGSVRTLYKRGDALYLDSVKCEGMEGVEVTSFAWLAEREFLFCSVDELLHYDKGEIVRVAEGCDGFDTDCLGNLWLLNEKGVMKFSRQRFYEKSLEERLEFDSFKESTLWSRLVIEAALPNHTTLEILVESDTKSELFSNADDMLLYGHKGEKLKVTLTLLSDSTRTASPQISSVKAIFDSAAYIDYMPAFYREEPESLHRFLSIFQSLSEDLAASVKRMESMIDSDLCDESFLSWLSGWLGLRRDYRWPEAKWREFLKQAPDLYAVSGTKKGLLQLLRIYTGAEAVIKEYDEPGKYFYFCVRIDPDAMDEGVDIEAVRAIVEEFKPAHTRSRVVIGYEMDDTPQITVGESVLPFNTVIENEKE